MTLTDKPLRVYNCVCVRPGGQAQQLPRASTTVPAALVSGLATTQTDCPDAFIPRLAACFEPTLPNRPCTNACSSRAPGGFVPRVDDGVAQCVIAPDTSTTTLANLGDSNVVNTDANGACPPDAFAFCLCVVRRTTA